MSPEAALAALRRAGIAGEVVDEATPSPLVGAGEGAGPPVARPPTRRRSVVCEIRPAQLEAGLRVARDQIGLELLSSVTATDEGDHFRLLYHLAAIDPVESAALPGAPATRLGWLVLSVRAARGEHPDGPVVPSAVRTYPGADLQEREIFDLMGVRFRGHPNLTRVLTWQGFSGHPLRKDYTPIDEAIPWRLAGLRGPDGSILDEAQAQRAEEERAAWEEVPGDAPLAPGPGRMGEEG